MLICSLSVKLLTNTACSIGRRRLVALHWRYPDW